MSEEAIKEAFGLSDEPSAGQAQEEIQQEMPLESNDDYLNDIPDEDRKYAKGWNPDGEKTLDQFINDGKWMERTKGLQDKMDSMEKDFQQRLKMVSKFHEEELKQREQMLMGKMREAVDMSDFDAVQQIQGELNEVKGKQQEVETQNQPEYPSEAAEWDAQNPWIKEDTPKATDAKAIFNAARMQGLSMKEALDTVDRKIAVLYPDDQPQQRAPKTMPPSSMPGRPSQSRKLTMNDLTAQEERLYRSMKGSFKSEEEFLKTVADIRSSKS